jgi:acetolactate synthase-1/2/3 large subunit
MDSIPLVILSGQVPTSMIGEDAFQETDMIGISRPVVKHSFLCKKASDIPEAIKKAYYIAASGRPGPVVVDLPKDVQNPKEKFPISIPSPFPCAPTIRPRRDTRARSSGLPSC